MVSDEYIRMSREAKEIQEGWNPAIGDMVVHYKENEETQIVEIITSMESMNNHFFTKDVVYIPYQEDLQKIMENNWEHGRCELIGHFHNFSWNYIHDRCKKYDFNELWLMVLMEYIYNKRWDGNGWVKQ